MGDGRLKYLRIGAAGIPLPVAPATAVGLVALGLEEGPGFVEVSSPGIAARWRVDHPEFGGQGDQTWLETGPASRAWASLGPQGGKVTLDRILYTCDPIATVDPADGSVTDVPGHTGANRAIVVRFWPASQLAEMARRDLKCCDENPYPSPPLTPSTMTRWIEVADQGVVTIGYPPDRRHVLHVVSSQNVGIREVAGCISGGATIGPGVILTTPAAQIQTRNVSPLVMVQIVNASGAAALVAASWHSHTAIREV